MSRLSRLLGVLRGGRVTRDLDDEMRFHLESRLDEFMAAGLSVEEATARARRQFGNQALIRETSRDIKLMPRLESILRDIAFAVRLWRRNKLVTGAALLSLSLAIGGCTAAFSLIDALILRTLPVDDPASLVYVALRAPSDARDGLSFNYPLFRELRTAGREHVRLFAVSDQPRCDAFFDDNSAREKVYAQWISGDAFAILGVKPALGRVLTPADDVNPGQHPVAVLSYDFWTRRFGGSPDVLGRWVNIREKPLQIVGVTAKGFTGVEPGIMTDVWAPMMMWDARAIADASTRWFRIWGRVQPGAAPEETRSVLQAVLTSFRREEAAGKSAESPERLAEFLSTRLHLRPAANGPSDLRNDFAGALWVLGALAVLVLLIASTNIAGLLAARGAARQREMAVRSAIGAGPGRLIQQAAIESALLSLVSCALGAVLAAAAAPQLVSMIATSGSVVRLDVGFHWRSLVFLAGAAIVVTLLFGLAPALQAAAAAPIAALRSRATRTTMRTGLLRPLVAVQVAFAFVVLFAAGLCLNSFVKLLRTDLGFDANNLALVRVTSASTQQNGAPPAMASWIALQDRLQALPGVESASLSRWGLFEGSGRNKSIRIPGHPADGYMPWYMPASPGFLRTMGISLLAGRDFEWRDAQPEMTMAVIVNESFAKRYFPGEPAVGKRFFRIDGGVALAAQEVIGVVRDAKYTELREAAPPTVYDPFQPQDAVVIQLRTRLDTAALLPALRQAIARTNPAFRLGDVTWQSTLVNNYLVRDRALALLSAFFSVVAGILVMVGLYGVLSYIVIQRKREIGIRLALGAQPIQVVRLVLSELGGTALVGLAAGGIGAVLTGRFVTAMLFDMTPWGAWSIAAPLVFLLIAGALASAIPAVRAARIAPSTALSLE